MLTSNVLKQPHYLITSEIGDFVLLLSPPARISRAQTH